MTVDEARALLAAYVEAGSPCEDDGTISDADVRRAMADANKPTPLGDDARRGLRGRATVNDHARAMSLASEADAMEKRGGNPLLVCHMRAEAAMWEAACLRSATGRRTRSIIGVSLAALQLKAGFTEACEATCRRLLSERLTLRGRDQLEAMLDEVTNG